MRRLLLTLILAAGAAGCRGGLGASAQGRTPAPSGGTDAAPQVMATVNGRPLYMRKLTDHLIRSYGMPLAEHYIASELVRQATERKNVTVGDDEVRAEIDRVTGQMLAHVPAAHRDAALEQVLVERGLTGPQWRQIMRRSALLRKLAETRVEVSEADIRDEFSIRYDGKVVVRDIQVASLGEAQKVLDELSRGADFAELAMKRSLHRSRSNGGLLPPIGAKSSFDWLSAAMKQTALSMKKVGEVSNPIQGESSFHLLKLEKIIPPENVKFEDVRDKLAGDLHERKVRLMQKQILRELIGRAKIEFVNPILKAQAVEGKRP